MFFRMCLAALALMLSVRADEVSLVRVSEPWRYFRGTNEPSTPMTAWRQISFDDSDWSAGPSGFSYNTAGIHEATVIADSPVNYLSIYFRKTFTLTDTNAVKWLVLRASYDDGFVAYLNGTEVARRSFPPDTVVRFDTPALLTGQILGEEIDLSAFVNLLVPDENVLGIQLHNSALQDTTMLLVPELLANFQRGPFVQNASSNSVQIIWKTPVASDSVVEFGITTDLGNRIADGNQVTNHVVTVTNLAPGNAYYYRVTSSVSGETATSPVAMFRTLKAAGPITFVAFGDSGSGSIAEYEVADVVRGIDPDLVLHVGDVVYPQFVTAQTDLRCLSVYGPHMRTTPYFFTIGNHDLYAGDGPYLEAFHLPTNATTGTEHFYSFEHGDAHFCSLFMPMREQNGLFPGYAFDDGTPQYRWLTNDLAGSTKPWKLLFFHIPLNTSGPHRSDFAGTNYDRLELQRLLLPICERYGVQLVLTGHDHAFERFAPMDGTHTVVTGGGGYALYSLFERDAASAQYWSAYHCAKVSITGDTLTLQAIDRTGAVFDWMTIQRALPPPRTYQAAWHTPLLESKPPDDGDGNINGQRFDFIGEAIPTLPGRFSNLGRVYVNNDRTRLYVGFEQAMFYADDNIFLFIQSPRLTGVTNLVGIGNGRVDPDNEGADGLDFLQNLSFTNFAPVVGCILGDEYGDYQYRYFHRAGLALNIGQGVFRLNSEIADVPGARLQQFNRSPQAGGVPGEENADFIEVAIPFAELGGLRPGDTIKLGAVAGGPAFDTNFDAQTRQLDSAFLGTALIGSGQGPVILEGLSVGLAPDPDPDSDGLNTAEEIALGTDPMNPDSDEDGLLDGWEFRNGLNPLSNSGENGANGDADADGLTNLQEQAAGTNPRSGDSDGDTLADAWEVRFGLDPTRGTGANGKDGDPDGDGFANTDEQLAGTDPGDANSLLRLILNVAGNNRHRLSWPAVPGKRYQLEFADGLTANFANVSSNDFPRAATSLNEFYEDVLVAPVPTVRYYRLRLVP
jgi:hypothetical protein